MSLSHSPSIVTDGLVLYLDAGNRRSYPGNGNTWFDLSRNNNHGSIVSGVSYDSSNGGNLSFNGSNGYILVNNSPSLTFSQNENNSFEYILNSNDFNNLVNGGIFSKSHFFNQLAHLSYNNTINVYQEQTGGTTTSSPGNFLLNFSNKWVHICITYNGSIISFYRNAQLISQSASGKTFNANSNTLFIGCNTGSQYFYLGKMALFKIYKKALSANEILQNFEAARGRFGL